MVVEQVAFEIPTDVAMGLTSGDLVRYGGVVRDAGGHIVTHLKETGIPEQSEKVLAKAMQVAKSNPRATGAVLFTAGAAVAGGVAHLVYQRGQTKACLARLHEAMAAYTDAMRDGAMRVTIIDQLLDAWTDAQKSTDPHIRQVLGADGFSAFFNMVVDYTAKVAEVNGATDSQHSSSESVIDLAPYLEHQKNLFSEAS